MNESKSSVTNVVQSIFRELAGESAERFRGDKSNDESKKITGLALSADFRESVARDIAFHLLDWNSDAAFIVALHLFPGRFTHGQIRKGVESFLIHAPNHVAAAAKLGGWPVEDIFEVDALSGPE